MLYEWKFIFSVQVTKIQIKKKIKMMNYNTICNCCAYKCKM